MNKIKYTQEFNDLWDLKPKRGGGNPKIKAFKAYNTRIKQGYEHAEIKAGLIRYATFCDKTAKIGSEYVMQMATFFGLNECWLEDWDVPVEFTKPDWTKLPFSDDDLWTFAKQYKFSNPGSMNYREYRRCLQNEISNRLNNQAAQGIA